MPELVRSSIQTLSERSWQNARSGGSVLVRAPHTDPAAYELTAGPAVCACCMADLNLDPKCGEALPPTEDRDASKQQTALAGGATQPAARPLHDESKTTACDEDPREASTSPSPSASSSNPLPPPAAQLSSHPSFSPSAAPHNVRPASKPQSETATPGARASSSRAAPAAEQTPRNSAPVPNTHVEQVDWSLYFIYGEFSLAFAILLCVVE